MRSILKCTYVMMILAFLPCISFAQCVRTPYTGDKIRTMVYGLAFKGSGGGGSFYDGLTIAQTALAKGATIASVDCAVDTSIYVVAGGIGQPTAILGKLNQLIQASTIAARRLASIEGKPLGGVLSVESGSINSLLALAINNSLSKDTLDLDGAGRSVPKLGDLTYAYEPITSINPVVLVNVNNLSDIVILHPTSTDEAEKMIGAIITQPAWGGVAGLALWPQLGADVKKSQAIRGTYADAFRLGQVITSLTTSLAPLEKYLRSTGVWIGQVGSSGDETIQSYRTDHHQRWDRGFLDLTGPKDYTVSSLNEALALSTSPGIKATLATAPHLVSLLVNEGSPAAPKWTPLTFGDENKLKSLVGHQASIWVTCANPTIYTIGDGAIQRDFILTLQQVFQYPYSEVIPPVSDCVRTTLRQGKPVQRSLSLPHGKQIKEKWIPLLP